MHSTCNAGWPVVGRIEGPDNSGFTMVAPTKRLCSGQLTMWTYQGKFASSFRAIVFRPVEGSQTKFKIVGMNDIPAAAANIPVVYSVPKADRIIVQEGEVIGWSFRDGFLTFDHEEKRSFVSEVRGVGGNLYANLTSGQILEMDRNRLFREYSIKATVKRQDQGKFGVRISVLFN